MTDKLPVVGKRYKATEANKLIINKDYIVSCDEILLDRVILDLDKDGNGGYIAFPIENFFKYFEEANPVEKGKVSEVESGLQALKQHLTSEEEADLIDKFNNKAFPKFFMRLYFLAQNIVNALESEKEEILTSNS